MSRAYRHLGAGLAASLNAGFVGAFSRYNCKLPATFCEEKKETKALWRVSYVSTMRGDQKTANENIHLVVESALKNNLKLNVSGHMCYDSAPQQVWQELEGSPEAVQGLWNKISKDARHDIDQDSVSLETEASSRRYPIGWGLRFSKFGRGGSQEPSSSACPPSKDLIQLSYKSFLGQAAGFRAELGVIDEIIPKAMMKNAKLDVTGFLLYNDRTFACYQVLEGPRDAVEKLWETIRNDPRHKVVADSVERRIITAREFPNWSMALDQVLQSDWSKSGAY